MRTNSPTVIDLPISRPYDILAVDDTLLNLELLDGILRTRGHRLRMAISGEEALRMMDKKVPDLVLLDIMMPEMDGFEVCERMKTNQRTSDVPVIFVSALGEIGHKMEAFHAGGVDYIIRPFEALEVLARVESQLRLRDFHSRLEVKVRERTAELRHTNAELEREVLERRRVEAELRESHHQLRDLSAHLLDTREEERADIAREVHDELGAAFTSLALGLAWMDKHLQEQGAALTSDSLGRICERISDLREQVAVGVQVARRIQTDLRPAILDDLGLLEAISWQVEQFRGRAGIPCSVTMDITRLPLPAACNVPLFRILQEALTNVARHSKAAAAEVRVYLDDEYFVMEICDDGIGVDAQNFAKEGSYGVRGMHERAWAISGHINASVRPKGGTCIKVSVPLPVEERIPHAYSDC